MPKPTISFHVMLARTTDTDVISGSGPVFKTLAAAEAEAQAKAPEWDGACIYEIETTWDRDELGPVPVETELSTRNYVKGEGGKFVLDEYLISR